MTKADMIETIFNKTERLLERAAHKEELYGRDSFEHNEARGEFTTAMSFIFALDLSEEYTKWQVNLAG